MSDHTSTRPRRTARTSDPTIRRERAAPPPPSDDRPADPSRMSAAELGHAGEQLAATYLERCGFMVLERNVHLRTGEIDIVALEGSTLTFIEVKTRRTLVTGVPQAAVTPTKLRRLRTLVGTYLMDSSPPHRDIRIDVVAVLAHADGTYAIEHLRGVG